MKALLLAAGYGTRLRPYTNTTPKACMPFCGLPQILYNCEILKQAKVTDIIINTHHLANEVVEIVNKHSQSSGLNISFSHEPQLLNSGGGIKKTKSFFNSEDNFFVINADIIMLPKDVTILKNMMAYHHANNAMATMSTVSMSESLPLAKSTDEHFDHRALWTIDSLICDINKTKQHLGSQPEHFTGCYVFSNKIFSLLPTQDEFHIFDGLIYNLIKNKKAFSFFFKDTYWYETGNKNDFIHAHDEIIKLLTADSPNTKLLKLAWERYGLDHAKSPDYNWVKDDLNRTLNQA